jgi:nucleotide-binding universal stress UspA family protein
MGTHGREGLVDSVLGSTTERVVARSRRSVWVIPELESDTQS